jgi:dihydrofolate synthase/folylpolyglutamate synthase
MLKRSLEEWLIEIEARHPSEIDLGLERISLVWELLKQEIPPSRSVTPVNITVAGTNGKGSCVEAMQALLMQHGYSVGAFTSPHFLHYSERIRIDGVAVSDKELIAAFELIEVVRSETSLTYFEFNALAALVIFRRADLDAVLLEVGLGGRLDAVNIIDADVAILSSVDLDHQDWLGDTRALIAREKLGIARQGKPLLVGEADLPDGFYETVRSIGASALYYGADFSIDNGGDSSQFSVNLKTNTGTLLILDITHGNLLPVNISLALQALVSAGFVVNARTCLEALKYLSLPGRQQRVKFQGVDLLLDVAHNPAAARVLAAKIPIIKGTTYAVASVLNDKDWVGIVAEIHRSVDVWLLGKITDNHRAMETQRLVEVVYNSGAEAVCFESVELAFDRAVQLTSPGDQVVVFGSFHTVSAVLTIISKEG